MSQMRDHFGIKSKAQGRINVERSEYALVSSEGGRYAFPSCARVMAHVYTL